MKKFDYYTIDTDAWQRFLGVVWFVFTTVAGVIYLFSGDLKNLLDTVVLLIIAGAGVWYRAHYLHLLKSRRVYKPVDLETVPTKDLRVELDSRRW